MSLYHTSIDDRADLVPRLIKYIPPLTLADYNFGGDAVVDCLCCWMIHHVNSCQAMTCGHLICKECWPRLVGIGPGGGMANCPLCRIDSLPQRNEADVAEIVEGGLLLSSSSESDAPA